MKRYNLRFGLMGIILALAVGTTLVWAQQGSSPPASAQAQGRRSTVNATAHSRSMYTVMEKLQAAITRARESNDLAKTKAALAEAQAELSRLEKVSQGQMNGGMGMMMGSRAMRGRMMGYSRQMMPMGGMGMMMGSRGMRGGMMGYSPHTMPMNGMYGNSNSHGQ